MADSPPITRAGWAKRRQHGHKRAKRSAERPQLRGYKLHILGYTIAYGLGIYLSKSLRLPQIAWWWLFLIPAALLALRLWVLPRIRNTFYTLTTVGCGVLLLLGWLIGSKAWERTDDPLPRTGPFSSIATVIERSSPTRLLVRVDLAFEARRWHAINRRIALRHRRTDTVLQNARRGDTFLLLLKPADAAPPNPHAFPYADWQRRHRIVGSYEAIKGFSSMAIYTPPRPDGWFKRMRHTMEQRLEALPIDARSQGLIVAMSLGEKRHLAPEVRASFQQSGLAHVLALSGLHVGIIYGFIYSLSRFFLSLTLWRRILRYGLPLVGVWLFTAIVGFSPSLLRAATMLTALTWSKIAPGENRPLASMSLAALLILLVDPLALWDVGFQLSFAAVLGILGLYKPLRSIYQPRPKILRWSWDIMCVSTAAQLGTLPLVLMHFGTVPTLSLVTNLVAIPIVTVLVPVTLLTSLLPQGCLVSTWLGEIIRWLSQGLLWCTDSVAQVPYAQLTGLRIASLEALLLAGGLIAAAIALWANRKKLLWVAGVPIAIVVILLAYRGHVAWGQEEWIAFHSPGRSLIAHRQGRKIQYISTRPSPWSQRVMDDYASAIPLAQVTDVTSMSTIDSSRTEGWYIQLGERTILLASAKSRLSNRMEKPSVDILVAGNCYDRTLGMLIERLEPELVLIDGSTPTWRLETLRATCSHEGVALHDTHAQGYWSQCSSR